MSLTIFHNKCITKMVQTGQSCSICLCRTYRDYNLLTLEASHGKQCQSKILKSRNRFIPSISSLFGLNTESNLFFSFHVFHRKNSSNCRLPKHGRHVCEQNDNMQNDDFLNYLLGKPYIANQNDKNHIRPTIPFSTVKIRFLFNPFTLRESLYL